MSVGNIGSGSGAPRKTGASIPGQGVNFSLDGADAVESAHRNIAAPAVDTETGAVRQKSDASSTVSSKPNINTPLTPDKVMEAITNLPGIKLDALNKQLGLFMAQHGVELSEDNFLQLHRLLKGDTSSRAMEHAVLIVSKGFGDVGDISMLGHLFSSNKGLQSSLAGLLRHHGDLLSGIKASLAGGSFVESFASVLSEFNDQLKKLKKAHDRSMIMVDRMGLLNDGLAMASMIEGLMGKYHLNNAAIQKYLTYLKGLNQSILGQLLVSQDSIKQPLGALEAYDYFQVPNPLSADAIVEVLRRKQIGIQAQSNRKKDANFDQEKIILSMETETMGTLVIVVVVMGFRVWCTVHSDRQDAVTHASSFRQELSNSLEKYQFKLEEFQSIRKKINVKKFIKPTQRLSDVRRIETEI